MAGIFKKVTLIINAMRDDTSEKAYHSLTPATKKKCVYKTVRKWVMITSHRDWWFQGTDFVQNGDHARLMHPLSETVTNVSLA